MKNFSDNAGIEFYKVIYDNNARFLAAVGHQGGYVYYALDEVEDGKGTKLTVLQIDDIIEICGAPDIQVIAITPNSPKTLKLYNILCATFNEYLKRKLDDIEMTNEDDEYSLTQ